MQEPWVAAGNQSKSRCFWCSQQCSFGPHTLNLRAFECGIPSGGGWWHYQCHRIPSWPLAESMVWTERLLAQCWRDLGLSIFFRLRVNENINLFVRELFIRSLAKKIH